MKKTRADRSRATPVIARLPRTGYGPPALQQAIGEMLDRHGVGDVRCGVDVGWGWLSIVDRALGELVAAGWDRRLTQVKEKFCELRIYLGDKMNERHQAIVEAAARRASAVCYDCGQPHGLVVPCNGSPLCKTCLEGTKKRRRRTPEGRTIPVF